MELEVDYRRVERYHRRWSHIGEVIQQDVVEQVAGSCCLARGPSRTDVDHRLGVAVEGTRGVPIQRERCQSRVAGEASEYREHYP